MHVHINQIINYFAEGPLQFIEAFEMSKKFPDGRTISYSSADCSSLIFTISGSAYVHFNGDRVKLESRHILHTTSKVRLTIEQCEDQHWNYVVVNYRLPVEDQKAYELYLQNYIITIENNHDLNTALQTLLDNYEQPSQLNKLQLKSNFIECIQYMLTALQEQTRSTKAEVMLKAVEYIHDRFNKPISVTQVSERFGIERRRFAYLFERYTGMTPNHYLTSFRMKRSRELLRAKHYTIAEIAELVGYQDSFYFSRVFKKVNGLSPSDFRKKIQY